MRLSTALEIINNPMPGFMVSFERRQGGMLYSDYFPQAGEDLIATELEAWELARRFAAKTVGTYVNIYVVKSDFVPVNGYMDRLIENRGNNV